MSAALSEVDAWLGRRFGKTQYTRGGFMTRLLLAAMIGAAGGQAFKYLPWSLSINTTASEQEGLYLLTRVSGQANISRGDLVSFRYACPQVHGKCPFSMVAPYPDGSMFLKRVAGVPGDRITLKGRTYYLTTPSGKAQSLGSYVTRSPSGLPITHHELWRGKTIPPGEYFMSGRGSKMSFDSRYYGLVKQSQIVARARLLIAWGAR